MELGPKRPFPLWFLGRNSIIVVYMDPLGNLGSPVVPFYPFSFWVPLLKPNSRKKGTLIKGLLGKLVKAGTTQRLLKGSWAFNVNPKP